MYKLLVLQETTETDQTVRYFTVLGHIVHSSPIIVALFITGDPLKNRTMERPHPVGQVQ